MYCRRSRCRLNELFGMRTAGCPGLPYNPGIVMIPSPGYLHCLELAHRLCDVRYLKRRELGIHREAEESGTGLFGDREVAWCVSQFSVRRLPMNRYRIMQARVDPLLCKIGA